MTKGAPIKQVERRFDFNLTRVGELVKLFGVLKEDTKKKHLYPQDILRAAVVLLHASLEDLLRELIRIKAMNNPDILIDQLRFPHPADPSRSVEQIKVAALKPYLGKTVDDLIDMCVSIHLSRRSFSSKEDIVAALGASGLEQSDYAGFYAAIEILVRRRHNIVHESDRPAHGSATHGTPTKITELEVSAWLKAVTRFGDKVLTKFKAAKAGS